jgi:hypothetical protein
MLELPQFKGTPGWEFTDISKLDLGSFEPGEPADAAPAIFDMAANATPLEGRRDEGGRLHPAQPRALDARSARARAGR